MERDLHLLIWNTDHDRPLMLATHEAVIASNQVAFNGDDPATLDATIRRLRTKLDALPAEERPTVSIFALAQTLAVRNEYLGDLELVDEVLARLREIASRSSDPLLATIKGELDRLIGLSLQHRYRLTGDATDATSGIEVLARLMDAYVPGSSEWALAANNLAGIHRAIFERAADIAELQRAIAIIRLLLTHTPSSEESYAVLLGNLGTALLDLLKADPKQAVLGEAIDLLRASCARPSVWQPGADIASHRLAQALERRHREAASVGDLEEAIAVLTARCSGTRDGQAPMELMEELAEMSLRRASLFPKLENVNHALFWASEVKSRADSPTTIIQSELLLATGFELRYTSESALEDLIAAERALLFAWAHTTDDSPEIGSIQRRRGALQAERMRALQALGADPGDPETRTRLVSQLADRFANLGWMHAPLRVANRLLRSARLHKHLCTDAIVRFIRLATPSERINATTADRRLLDDTLNDRWLQIIGEFRATGEHELAAFVGFALEDLSHARAAVALRVLAAQKGDWDRDVIPHLAELCVADTREMERILAETPQLRRPAIEFQIYAIACEAQKLTRDAVRNVAAIRKVLSRCEAVGIAQAVDERFFPH